MDINSNNEVDVYEDDGKEEIVDEIKPGNEVNKSKTSKRTWLYTSVVILCILLYAAISVGSYMPIRSHFLPDENNLNEYILSHNFSYDLARLTESLNHSILDDTYYNDRYSEVESVQFYITDEQGNIIKTNVPNITESSSKKRIKDSQFYLQINFNEKGDVFLESSLGEEFENRFSNILLNSIDYDQNREEYANTKITYMIFSDFDAYKDIFSYNMKEKFVMEDYIILILAIGAVSILLLLIITLIVPYSLQMKIGINRFYNNMYLEIKGLLWIAFIFAVLAESCQLNSYYLYDVFNIVDSIYHGNLYFYIIGISITFILYLMTYLSISYLKNIRHEGFKDSVIKKSIIGKIFLQISKYVKALALEIVKIDTREEIYKKLILLLGINFILLLMIAIMGPFGILLAIVYTVFLFNYLLKVSNKLKELYEASSKLAAGDFELVVDEDQGVLSPIFKELNRTKIGFKLAVEKEVKSQQMKTELITNVSHDLRTPLTSIITYVDLLKTKDIDEKSKREYLAVLEQKSKRLKVLVEDLFEASKASSGSIELHPEELDVIALLRQTLGELDEEIKKSTLQIKVNTTEDKVLCNLDGRRTYRIFSNIISNILKYSMPNSRVYIDVIGNQSSVSIIFKNISNYEMNFNVQEITERLTRGDKSRSTEGSGLGLAIAKSLVELQGGNIDVSVDGDLFKVTITFKKAI